MFSLKQVETCLEQPGPDKKEIQNKINYLFQPAQSHQNILITSQPNLPSPSKH